jgi:ComF family protein
MSLFIFLKSLTASRCLLCQGAVRGIKPLCAGCEEHLPWNTQTCWRCAMPMHTSIAEHTMCADCLRHAPLYTHAVCAFRYEAPVSTLLNRYKHSKQLSCGHWLAYGLAHHIQTVYAARGWLLPDGVMPLSLHWRRLQRRSFDQSHEIARVLARQLHLPLVPLLQRRRETISQQGLSRAQRQTNVAGAFTLRRAVPFRRVALVDDVLTTGSTAAEVAQLLYAAGVEQVYVWAVARTP